MSSPLYTAAERNKVRSLLREISPIELNWQNPSSGYTALHIAAAKGHADATNALLSFPDLLVNQGDHSLEPAFLLACNYGRVEVVKALLKDPRVDVNFRDLEDCSPLWLATHESNLDVMTWMMASGRHLEAKRPGRFMEEEMTPLEHALGNGNMAAVALLEGFLKDEQAMRRTLRKELKIEGMNCMPCVLDLSSELPSV